jgi:glutamate-1-semialdehyde 2,1-aminomutase
MLNYLRDHKEEVYPLLEKRGQKIREGIKNAFDSNGVEEIVTGTGSLFQTHFPFEKGKKLDSPHSIHKWTDIKKREVEFKIRMLIKGIHVMHGGGSLSLAHSDGDIKRIIEATKEVAREMVSS